MSNQKKNSATPGSNGEDSPQRPQLKREGKFTILSIEPKRKKVEIEKIPGNLNQRLYSEVVSGVEKTREPKRMQAGEKQVASGSSHENETSSNLQQALQNPPGESFQNQCDEMEDESFITKLEKCFSVIPIDKTKRDVEAFYACIARYLYRDTGLADQVREKVETHMQQFDENYRDYDSITNKKDVNQMIKDDSTFPGEIIFAATLCLEINIILVKPESTGLISSCYPRKHFLPRTCFIAHDKKKNFYYLKQKFNLDSFFELNGNFDHPGIFLAHKGERKGKEGENNESDTVYPELKTVKKETEGCASGSQKDSRGATKIVLEEKTENVDKGLRPLNVVVKRLDLARERKKREGGNGGSRKGGDQVDLNLGVNSKGNNEEEFKQRKNVQKKVAPVSVKMPQAKKGRQDFDSLKTIEKNATVSSGRNSSSGEGVKKINNLSKNNASKCDEGNAAKPTEKGSSVSSGGNSNSKEKVVRVSEEENQPVKNDDASGCNGKVSVKPGKKGHLIKCPKCIKRFTSEALVQKHLGNSHGADRPYRCQPCGYQYKKEKALRSHIYNTHKCTTWLCKVKGCEDLVFDNRSALQIHKNKFHIVNHDCKVCGDTFDSYDKLRLHRTRVHNDDKLLCHICNDGVTYNCTAALNNHYNYVHPGDSSKCKICGIVLLTVKLLNIHIENVHCKDTGHLKCRFCERKFHRKQYLIQHELVHDPKEYICTECGKKYSASYMRSHMSIEHGSKVHPCEHENCPDTFPSNYRLQRHIQQVHEENKFVCPYCETDFTFKENLDTHLKYVHTIERKFKCEEDDCDHAYKTKSDLTKHQKNHQAPEQYDCELCDQKYKLSKSLRRHMRLAHGLECARRQTGHRCVLCYPPMQFPTSSSWSFHRIANHPESLAPEEAQTLEQVYKGHHNRIFVTGDDVTLFLRHSGGKCKECSIEFFDNESEESHIAKYHAVFPFSQKKFQTYLVACKNETNSETRVNFFRNLYEFSTEAFPIIDKRRKVYDLLFVPEQVQKHEIESWVADEKNQFYMYSGKMSAGVKRFNFVSDHHARDNTQVVCTNQFQKITGTGSTKYAAFLINEKYINDTEEEILGLDQLKKDEARDIFTLFCFAKYYERDDVYFQKLEESELSVLTRDDISNIIKDVKDSNGNLFNLRRFQLKMLKKLEIATGGVDVKDVAFQKCKKCLHKSPLLVSKFHETKHNLECHGKVAKTVTEQLLKMSTLNAPAVHELLQIVPGDKNYYVYLAVGSDTELKTTEEALLKAKSGYVGQSTNNPVATYHFRNNIKITGLKLLKNKFKYVYLIKNWRLYTKEEMERTEAALIIKGSIIFRKMNEDREGITLVNTWFPHFSSSNLFKEKEWLQLAEVSSQFDAQVPEFVTSVKPSNELIDLTDRIPGRTGDAGDDDYIPSEDDEEDDE